MKRKPTVAILICVALAACYVGVIQLLSLTPLADTIWGGVAAYAIMAGLALTALLLLRQGWALRRLWVGFIPGVTAAGFLAVYLWIMLMVVLVMGDGLPSLGELAPFAVTMLAVGLGEELMFRGLIQNLLANCFGRDTRKGVWATVAVSGCIFGVAHLTNIFSGVTPLGAVMQALAACALGMYFGAIYARCGNIWVMVLLHAANDFVAFLASGFMGAEDAVEAISSYGPERLVSVALYLGLTAFLLRKKKLALEQ